jgi:GTP-binding protein EngB required for normal cell division
MSNSKICTIEIKGGKEIIKFAKKFDLKENLANIRIKLGNKISSDTIFILADNSDISKEDEKDLNLEEIIDGKLIRMKYTEIKNNNNFDIYKNGNFKEKKNFLRTDKLNIIRNLIIDIITEEGIFISQDGEILKEDENDFILEDILEGNKINIKLPSEKTLINISENQTPFENMPNAPEVIPKNIPLQNSTPIETVGNLNIYEYPKIDFTKEEIKKAIKIMVLGPTGSGKTTLLNSYINYLMDINYSDNFRYKIINEITNKNEVHSQTSEVTNYNIRAKNNKLYQIIDTPGFGDTSGIEKDEQITNKISDFFLYKTGEINAICLVLKSSDNRLAACQKYIFNCIFDLFGEDMKKVFLAMLTFCDGGKPQVLKALQDESCLFSQFIFSLGKDWYYKFNNSAIFEKNEDDILNLTYWNIGMASFKTFTKKLDTLPKVNLIQTRRVLELRSHLNINIEILSKKLKEGLNKMDELKQTYKIISDIKGDINDSRNYTKKIKVNKTKQVKTEPGVYMTTCLICTRTCHRNCSIANDDHKDGCGAMNWKTESDKDKRHCLYCPKQCHWTQHKNRPYEIVDYQEEQTITLDYVKQKYCNSNTKLISKSETLRTIKTELIKLNIVCMKTQNKMMKCINELHKIALNKSVFNSVEEHIDELILVEKAEHKDGWQNRVEGLQILKKQKQNYRELCEGKNDDLLAMSLFIESSYEDDKALQDFISKENGTNINNYQKCNIF